MDFSTFTIAAHLIKWLGFLTSVYGVYFVVLALWGEWRKKAKPQKGDVPPETRFALLIAARNEADVIGNLIASLQRQSYPAELYDIFVAPNNCTDNTRGIAEACGARIFDPVGEIRSKGDVLAQFVRRWMTSNQYDAICVFDADNIVHPDFLHHMNRARQSGAQVAQGFKNSKNPGDNAVAASFSIYFWIIDRFYNASREALGLSSFVTGTGFMATLPFLEKMGGWNTRTITEDYEFSAQCVLAGERVHYVGDAIVYDEQPLTFTQSWKQRRRWSTGNFDSSRYYLKDLCKEAVRRRSTLCLDLAMTYLSPVIFVLSLLGLAGQTLLGKHGVTHFSFPGQPILWVLALCLLLAALFTYKQNRRTLRGFCMAAGSFLFLLASWMPINLITLLRKQRKWEMIPHTRSISLEEM